VKFSFLKIINKIKVLTAIFLPSILKVVIKKKQKRLQKRGEK